MNAPTPDAEVEQFVADFESLASKVYGPGGAIGGYQISADAWRALRAQIRRLAQAQAPTPCPTMCDDDCDEDCHERHQPTFKRDHDPDECETRSGYVYVEAQAPTDAREALARVKGPPLRCWLCSHPVTSAVCESCGCMAHYPPHDERERRMKCEAWDEALRWVRQQAGVTDAAYVLDRIDRAEPFNPYRADRSPEQP